MLAITLKFPARRFHATPWGRQVNEGAVEWPPSPWRLLRSLIATWHHKFPSVPEQAMRELIDLLVDPPSFALPPASLGHSRHYMPLANDKPTKVFDTFIAVDPEQAVLAVWPHVTLTDTQRDLLRKLLRSMSYFGRAESWVEGDLADADSFLTNAEPMELGSPGALDQELVRTLVPISPAEHSAWYQSTRELLRSRKLTQLQTAAAVKKKPLDKVKLSKKDEQAIDDQLPATLFDALHADTTELRKAGWNQPPGSRWINYARPSSAFTSQPRRRITRQKTNLPTVARFAVAGAVRPQLTDAIVIGDQVRRVLMGCSRKVSANDCAAPVFSGKHPDGAPFGQGHCHAHFLPESSAADGRISYVTVYAPMGFDGLDEKSFTRLAQSGIWGRDGYELQLVLLGVGTAIDFGGLNERSGQSRLLATARVWESRTPFVLTRHLTKKRVPSVEEIAKNSELCSRLIDAVRHELTQREQFRSLAANVEIEPILERSRAGTDLGGHFTSWLKFRRERPQGGGKKACSQGFGFRLTFPSAVTGPVALGYSSHFGLGTFVAVES